ncbi:SGNH/GDSL hydrolase family protein [Streptomyces sp. NPDC047000]|uniref:SGNH/GDSL hydrolase family protein n=1 Tax=Streptomyces sp. NPDC047000 TaxID=3155474 RepID=UPI0033DD7A0E
MTRPHGYAMLSALTALTVAISAAIYVGAAADNGTAHRGTAPDARAPHSTAAPASVGTWVGAWAASPVGAEPGTETGALANRSLRNVVHATASGTSARITLSNLYGQSPLTVTHATLAVATDRTGDGAAAVSGSMRRITFGGSASVVVRPGGQVLSDAVRVDVTDGADLLVTTYSPTPSGPVTYHPHARQVSYSARGDRAEDVTGAPYTEEVVYWRYLTAVDVLSGDSDGTVVALGDSLTDGITSTENANHRWTDRLAARLRKAVASGEKLPRYSVVNEGISGNQVFGSGLGRPADNQSALLRFGRDALSRTNVKVVVIDLGINDILSSPRRPDPQHVTAGLRTLVRQAHAHGLKVIGATLMPCKGHLRCTTARDTVRQQVNAKIRAGRVFDAYVDFDKALRDPYDPRQLLPDYDSGDHLHPSDLGYARMAAVFDLRELKGAGQTEL